LHVKKRRVPSWNMVVKWGNMIGTSGT